LMYEADLRGFVQDLTRVLQLIADNKQAMAEFADTVMGVVKGLGYLAAGLVGAWVAFKGGAIIMTAVTSLGMLLNVVERVPDAAGRMASSWGLLGKVLKVVPIVGTIFLIAELALGFLKLGKAIEPITAATLALVKAQRSLNEELGGASLSAESEALAVEAAASKESVAALTEEIWNLRWTMAELENKRITVVDPRDIEQVKKAYNEAKVAHKRAVDEMAKAQEKAFKDLITLIRSELDTLARNAIVLPIRVEFAKDELRSALTAMLATAKKLIDRDLSSIDPFADWDETKWGVFGKGFSVRQIEALVKEVQSLAKENPGMKALADQFVRQASEVLSLREEVIKLTKAEEDNAEATATNKTVLEQRLKALSDTARAMDIVNSKMTTYNSITAVLEEVADAYKDVQAASDLENASLEQKKAHYQRIIDQHNAFRDSLILLQEKVKEWEVTAADLGAKKLTGIELTDAQKGKLNEAVEGMKTVSLLAATFKSQSEEATDAYAKLLELLFDKNKDLEESYIGLKESLQDFLDTANGVNFGDTISRQMDKIIEQSVILVERLNQARSAISYNPVSLPSTGGSTGGRTSGGASYPLVQSGTGATQYKETIADIREYTKVAASALGVQREHMALFEQIVPVVHRYGKEYGVSAELVLSLMKNESAWNTWAKSKDGAFGLMQLMPDALKDVNDHLKENLNAARDTGDAWEMNVQAGIKYIAIQRDIYKSADDLERAAGSYNAGAGASDRVRGLKETSDYIKVVTKDYSNLTGALGEATTAQTGMNAAADDWSGSNLDGSVSEVTTAMAATTAVTEASTVAVLANANAIDSVSVARLSEAEEIMIVGAALYKQLHLRNQEEVTIEKLNKGIETEIRLRGEHAQALARLTDLQRKLDAGGTLTDEEVQLWQKYQEQVQKVAQQIDVVAQMNEKANDELIKTGGISQDIIPKHIDRINEIAEAFDSAWSRNRRYNEEMANINRAFAAGKLTETEKGLESISASLRRLDPETRNIAEAFGATFKNILSGTEKAEDAFKNLKQTIIDTMLQRYVIDVVVNFIGNMIQPVVQGVGGTMLGAVGGKGGIGGMMQGLGSIGKGISSIFSGAAFSGITTGFGMAVQNIGAAGYFGAMGSTLSTAASSAASGAWGTAIGMAAPYIVPALIAVAAIATIMKKSDTPPRAAWDVGPMRAWEDGVYSTSKGLGVNFGFGGKSHKVDANEYKGAFDAMAEMADALAEFYGKEVAAQVRDMINNNVHVDGGKGLRWNNKTFDFNKAFDVIFTEILNMGAKTGDVMAQALRDEAGDLEADAEKAAEQISNAMNAVLAYKEISESWDTPIGKLLGVTGDLGADIQLLRGYVKEFGNASESSAETIARLLATAQQVELAARLTATSLEGMSGQQVLEFGDELAEAFGGLEKLTTAQAFYYDQFFSAQEKVNRLMGEAIDSINAKLPKLRDEILALGQDITTTVKTLATEAVAATTEAVQGAADLSREAIDQALKGDFPGDAASGAGGEFVALHKLMQKDKEATDAWMRSMKEGRQVWEDYVASLTSGVDKITDAAKTPAQAQIETITTTITPGDPNAAIYAALIAGIPPTREAFNDLMGAIDLTSEAGKKLYAGLLELAPQFDLLYDAAEAFQGWIDPAGNAAASIERLQDVFADLGVTMPETGAALLDLYESGKLTTEQMAMLGASLADLQAIYDPMIAQEKALADARQELALLTLELEQGPEAALAERRRLELEALDESLRPMQERIWALEDETAALKKAADAMNKANDLMNDVSIRLADLQDPAGAQQRAREREIAEAIKDQTPETAAELRRLYEELWRLEDAAAAVAAAMAAIKEREGLMIRLAEASGNSAEATRLRREIELRDALDETNRALLRHIYAIEDARAAMTKAIDDEYNAKIAAIDAAQKAQQAAHQAAIDALNKQRDAAQEALNVAQGLLSTIQSALDGMRGQQEYDELSHARAAKQLAAWAKENTLPDVDKLSKVLDILAKADKQDYATEADYRYAQAQTFANLLALEAKAVKEVNWAEKQLKAIEDQVAALNKMNDSIMDGFQAQRDQANAWRDAQLAAMEAQLKAMAALASVLGGARPGPIPGTPPIPGAPPIPGTPIPPPTPLPPPADNYQKLNEAQIAEIKALREEMGLLRKDMAAIGTAQVVPLSSMDERMRKWDSDGLPPGRENVILLRAG
jgi:hypothetical protein